MSTLKASSVGNCYGETEMSSRSILEAPNKETRTAVEKVWNAGVCWFFFTLAKHEETTVEPDHFVSLTLFLYFNSLLKECKDKLKTSWGLLSSYNPEILTTSLLSCNKQISFEQQRRRNSLLHTIARFFHLTWTAALFRWSYLHLEAERLSQFSMRLKVKGKSPTE